MGRLTVISDQLEGSFDLPGTAWKIGRGNDCDIQLVHKSVSRHHCVISEADGQLRVEDLGSTYGTFINGAQVVDAHAGNGDKVKLGRIVLVYETVPATQAQAAPQPSAPRTSPPNVQAPAAAPQQPPPKPKLVPNRPPPAPAPSAPAPATNLPPAGPVARFKNSAPPEENEPRRPEPKAAGGVYNRLQGGHQRKGKAERPDYEKESEAWERQSEEMSDSGGPDYAAEAEDWERVWGKTKKRKGGFFFGGASSGGGMMAAFGSLSAKLRAVILVAILGGIALGGKVGYERATAHILVPKNAPKAEKKSLRPTIDNKDAILEKAVETFGKTIPEELREKD